VRLSQRSLSTLFTSSILCNFLLRAGVANTGRVCAGAGPKEGKVLERLCRTRPRHIPFLPAFLRPRALPLGSVRDLGHWMAGSREDGVHAGGCFRCGGHHFARECTLPKKYPHAFLPAPTTALGNAGRWAGAIIVMGRTTHPATAPKRCATSPRSRAQLWSLSSRYFRICSTLACIAADANLIDSFVGARAPYWE
jgi:hypothetical protein